ELVVGPEVLDVDTRLRDAGGAPRFEHVDRLAGVSARYPALHRPPAEPLVFEVGEARQAGEPLHLPGRGPPGFPSPVEPEGRTGLRREVPAHDLADMGVETVSGSRRVKGLS